MESKRLLQESETQPHPFDVSWRERVLALGCLFSLLAVGYLLLRWYRPAAAVEVLGLIPVTFVAVGKFLPLWSISGKSSLSAYELGTLIWILDTFTVIVFVYSFEAFYRLGPLQRALDSIYMRMRLVLDAYPRMRRASVVGVILFVLFPVSGTGALAASVIGALLRMHRGVLITAVSFGGLMGGYLMGFLSVNFASALQSFRAFQNNPNTTYWAMGVLALMIAVGVYYLNRAFRRALATASEQAPKL